MALSVYRLLPPEIIHFIIKTPLALLSVVIFMMLRIILCWNMRFVVDGLPEKTLNPY